MQLTHHEPHTNRKEYFVFLAKHTSTQALPNEQTPYLSGLVVNWNDLKGFRLLKTKEENQSHNVEIYGRALFGINLYGNSLALDFLFLRILIF